MTLTPRTFALFAAFAALALCALPALAQPAEEPKAGLLTETELEKAFQEAAQRFKNNGGRFASPEATEEPAASPAPAATDTAETAAPNHPVLEPPDADGPVAETDSTPANPDTAAASTPQQETSEEDTAFVDLTEELEEIMDAGDVMPASATSTALPAQAEGVDVDSPETIEMEEGGVDITPMAEEIDWNSRRMTVALPVSPSNKAGKDIADVTVVPSHAYSSRGFGAAPEVPLKDIRLAVDFENQSINHIVSRIVTLAEEKTGPWQVKWRLRKENEQLLDHRVNLTAETSFSGFMDHLVDRINNMTGVRLFVTVFETSRIIIISDTFY